MACGPPWRRQQEWSPKLERGALSTTSRAAASRNVLLGSRSCAQRRAMPSPLSGSPAFTVFLEPRSGRGWLCPQGTFGSDVLSLRLQVSGTGWGPRVVHEAEAPLSFLSFSPMRTASRRLCNVGT